MNIRSKSESTSLSIIHVDMDAFFASIEQRDNPSYRNKPVVVGGDPNGRGVVSTASYEARKFGVHSAMACGKAKELCPNVIFLPVDMEKYKRVSQQIHTIFSHYTNVIEPVSIDEAFLDVDQMDAVEVAGSIKKDIRKKLYLTASVGVSYNKFLAKLASDMKKPDGLTIITHSGAKELLPGLPIRKIWGVGKKTEKELNDIGIYTIGDLLQYDHKFLLKRWGKRAYELLKLAHGIGDSTVYVERDIKSIGEENTLSHDTCDAGILRNYLRTFALAIGKRLSEQKLKYRTITVKIKYYDFTNITRSITLTEATASPLMIYRQAEEILRTRVSLKKPVRLIGIQVSNLVYPDEPVQLTFKDIY